MSNKTLRASAKKIASARNPIIIGLFVLVAGLGILFRPQSKPVCNGTKLGNECYVLDRADTAEEQIQGLSGRMGLAPKTGMLFDFKSVDTVCMWMKDMRFDIDIVWLDSNKMVTKIERGLTPATYPAMYCGEATKYVIELPSGDANRIGLALGNRVNL